MDIEDLATNTLETLKRAINANTIVGEPMSIDGATVVPVSKVTFGYVTGGGEYSESTPKVMNSLPNANLSGGGASVSPIGFLVCAQGKFNFVSVNKTEDSKWGDLIEAAIRLVKKEK